MSNWTPEMDAELRRRWGAGHTASKIAREMHLVSRNAAIGRAARLGLTKRPSPIKSRDPAATAAKRQRSIAGNSQHGGAAKRVAVAKEAALRPAAPVNVKVDERGDRWSWKPRLGLSRMGDGARHSSRDACAWPIGDPKHPDFHFCQAKPVVPGKPYCAHHCCVAYRSPEEAAKERAEQAADREAA